MNLLIRLVALSVLVVLQIQLFSNTAFAAAGDGLLIYGEGTITTPRYRTWDQYTPLLSSELSAGAAAATIRHIDAESAPTRNEIIMGSQATTGALHIQRWNGTIWSNEWNVVVGNGSLPRFDIIYETTSGRAVVVYSGNSTTNELRYRIWNGSSWTAELSLNAVATTGIIHAVKLAAQPGTNNIALAWGDANLDLSAATWNGTTWQSEPTSALSTNLSVVGTATALTNSSFDISYESQSGDVLVVWGDNTITDAVYATRSAGIWSTPQAYTTITYEVTDMELVADPTSNTIGFVSATDNGTRAEAAIWKDTWVSVNIIDTTTDTIGASTKNISGGWIKKGTETRLIVIYDDVNAAGIDWKFYTSETNIWSAAQADVTVTPVSSNVDDKLLQLKRVAFEPNELIALQVDSNSDLLVKRLVFDGTSLNWSSVEPGLVSPETTVSSITGYAAAFTSLAYDTGSAAVDIVNASGISISAPIVTFPAATASIECQIKTATFGTTSEQLRITNTSGKTNWSVSIAPSTGPAALWNGGLSPYDINDLAGCTDGPDADAVGGQLSINPTTAIITPRAGCSNTGITPGVLSNFTEGTQNNITLLTATASDINCFWDMQNIGLSQIIPGETKPGNYGINMVVTIVAS